MTDIKTDLKKILEKAQQFIDLKQYDEAVETYRKALHLTDSLPLKIDIFNTLGRLSLFLENNKAAEQYFFKSLSLHEELPESQKNQLKLNKAMVLSNLAMLARMRQDHLQAITLYQKSLKLLNSMEEQSPIQEQNKAEIQYNLADLLYQTGQLRQAKNAYLEALKFYEKNDKFTELTARIYFQLANVYMDQHNMYDSQRYFIKAMRIFDALSQENPAYYLPLLASVYNNLAVVAKTMYKYDDAAGYYKRTLKVYEQLLDIDRKLYLPFYANTLNGLGIVYTEQMEVRDDYDSGGLSGFSGAGIFSTNAIKEEEKEKNRQYRLQQAETYFKRALLLYREMAVDEPEKYQHYVANVLHNLAVLYDENKKFNIAQVYYKDAINLREKLSRQANVFIPDLIASMMNLITMNQYLLEATGDINYKKQSIELLEKVNKYLAQVDHKLPVIESMKSDWSYFSNYFNEVDEAYVDIIVQINKTNVIKEKITETLDPREKMHWQEKILDILSSLKEKYPDNNKVNESLALALTDYSWYAMRAGEFAKAKQALKSVPDLPVVSLTKAINEAHLQLLQGDKDKALQAYQNLKDQKDLQNEPAYKIMKLDWETMVRDGLIDKDLLKRLLDLLEVQSS